MWSPVWSGSRTYKPSSFTYSPSSDEQAVDCTSCEWGIGKRVKENRDSCKCNKHLSHSFPKLVQFCGHGESKGPLYTLLLPKVCQNQIIALRIFLSKVRSSPDKAKENSKPTELPPPPWNDEQKYLSLKEVLFMWSTKTQAHMIQSCSLIMHRPLTFQNVFNSPTHSLKRKVCPRFQHLRCIYSADPTRNHLTQFVSTPGFLLLQDVKLQSRIYPRTFLPPSLKHFSSNTSKWACIFWVTGFTNYKSWKRRHMNCDPHLHSSCSTALFHPGAVIARASESTKGTWDEKKGGGRGTVY